MITAISSRTALFGVIGHPVGHSLGPAMHNAAFGECGIDAVYLAFDVTDPAGAMAAVRSLGVRGLSVTIPHKVAVMEHLDEIDPMARRIGAVNTVVNAGGWLTGYNTDWTGALAALKDVAIAGSRAVVLGAGGAARAIGFGLIHAGGRVTIVNRTRGKGEALAGDIGAEFRSLDDLPDNWDILINTTPVGMASQADATPVGMALEADATLVGMARQADATPVGMARQADARPVDMASQADARPVSEAWLIPGATVMDIIYNPLETALLRAARRRGCRTVDGLAMFAHQGAAQFQLWTRRTPPLDIMRRGVAAALKERA